MGNVWKIDDLSRDNLVSCNFLIRLFRINLTNNVIVIEIIVIMYL